MTSLHKVVVGPVAAGSAHAPATSDNSNSSGDRGRTLVLLNSTAAAPATGAAVAGDLVLREPPAAKVLLPALWSSRCHRCFVAATAAPLSRCGRCRTAYYCSRACQQADWTPDHRAECPWLAQFAALPLHASQTASVLLLGRMMRHSASSPSPPAADVAPSDLAWHDADVDQEALLLVSLAQKFKLVDESLSTLELQRMIGRFESNNFTITDELLLGIGSGCYPLAAMASHSCEPNCSITFSAKDQQAEFRAMRAIAAGEELTHSYVDPALPRRQRQLRLEHKYHFQCGCTRCSMALDDPRSKDANLDFDIDGVPEAQWSDARVQAVGRAKALMVPQPEVSSDSTGAAHTMRLALKALQTELHAENTSLLEANSALFSAEMERANAATAIPFGEQMLAFYRRVYPASHPLVGLHLFTLGDLHMGQGDFAVAVPLLREAKQVLQLSHGRAHPFVELLSERLQACGC